MQARGTRFLSRHLGAPSLRLSADSTSSFFPHLSFSPPLQPPSLNAQPDPLPSWCGFTPVLLGSRAAYLGKRPLQSCGLLASSLAGREGPVAVVVYRGLQEVEWRLFVEAQTWFFPLSWLRVIATPEPSPPRTLYSTPPHPEQAALIERDGLVGRSLAERPSEPAKRLDSDEQTNRTERSRRLRQKLTPTTTTTSTANSERWQRNHKQPWRHNKG